MLDAGTALEPGAVLSAHGTEAIFTGTCEVSLRRAVVPFREPRESARPGSAPPGGRIYDLGLGLVLENPDPLRARVLDLGSGEARDADLSGPVVLLGWVFHRLFRELVKRLDDPPVPGELARLTRPMALGLISQAGFTSLTRPLHLRMGFHDVCQDLDLHEEAAVRILLPETGPVRCHMDHDMCTLVIRTGRSRPSPELEAALADAFPARRLLLDVRGEGQRTHDYHVVLPVSRSLSEMRQEVRRLRRGFLHLIARFEPERYRALREATDVFGERDSLALLPQRAGGEARRVGERVGRVTSLQAPRGIH